MNPPFQGTYKSAESLWPRFIRLAATLSDKYAAIVPSSVFLANPNIRRGRINCWQTYIRDRVSVIKFGCDFNKVGRSSNYMSYFICDGRHTKIITQSDEFYYDVRSMDQLPLHSNKVVFDIAKKVQNYCASHEVYPFQRGERHIAIPSKKVVGFHSFDWGPKKLLAHFDLIGGQDYSKINSKYYWIPIPNDATIESLTSIFYSKLFQLWPRWFSVNYDKAFYRSLPPLDLTKVWTDQEIYIELGLTEDEIKEIEV